VNVTTGSFVVVKIEGRRRCAIVQVVMSRSERDVSRLLSRGVVASGHDGREVKRSRGEKE
jgi:hypothetical protein